MRRFNGFVLQKPQRSLCRDVGVYVMKIVSLSGQNLSDVLFHCFMISDDSHSAFSTNNIMDLALNVNFFTYEKITIE